MANFRSQTESIGFHDVHSHLRRIAQGHEAEHRFRCEHWNRVNLSRRLHHFWSAAGRSMNRNENIPNSNEWYIFMCDLWPLDDIWRGNSFLCFQIWCYANRLFGLSSEQAVENIKSHKMSLSNSFNETHSINRANCFEASKKHRRTLSKEIIVQSSDQVFIAERK